MTHVHRNHNKQNVLTTVKFTSARKKSSTGPCIALALLVAASLIPSASAQKEQTLFNFSKIGGDGSNAGLTWDSTHTYLVGSSASGGTSGAGLIYEITLKNGTVKPTVIYQFNSANNANGAGPSGSLTFYKNAIYGVTSAGGNSSCANCGVLFELQLVKGAVTETVLHAFAGGTDGVMPYGGVAIDSKGNIYGTTRQGGGSSNCQNGCGVVYELSKMNGVWQETILHAFTGWPPNAIPGDYYDGVDPYWCTPALDASGNLYGTTYFGGLYEYSGTIGTVWKLSPTGDGQFTYQVIYNFDRLAQADDGANPSSGVTVGPDGNLYGTTYFGGINDNGAVFSSATDGSSEGTIFSFNVSDGENPDAPVVFDGAGDLYGTTWTGGLPNKSGDGAVYELSPNGSSWEQTLLFGFSGSNGSNLDAPVALDSNGVILGTSFEGGSTGSGVVFAIIP